MAAGLSVMAATSARAQPVPAKSAQRAIDIHAHYYPQGYLDLFNTEGQRFNAEARVTEQGFSFKTPAGSNNGLPLKFIHIAQILNGARE